MSKTKTTEAPAVHAADTHDLIRVQGARVNNLKDISVEIPKRRLTVFTGVSGSGKSSLVFATIAAESQRMINETYSAFVQGFMPTLSRPEVDVLDGLTTAIIVDQERMGANPRSTVGTATDANAMLRILFSRLGQAAHRPAHGVRVQRPDAQGERGDEHREGGGRVEKTVVRKAVYQGGMCPRCEGMGSRQRLRPDRAVRRHQVAQRGCADRPGLPHGRLVRPHLRGRRPADGQADREVHQEGARHDAVRRADQDQGRGHQPHLRGIDPQDPEVDAVQGRRGDAAARTPVRGARDHLPRPAPTATAPGSARRRCPSKIKGKNIADLCQMQISDLAEWMRDLDEPGRRAAGRRAAAPARLVRRRSGWATSRSTGRRARCPGERRSAPR